MQWVGQSTHSSGGKKMARKPMTAAEKEAFVKKMADARAKKTGANPSARIYQGTKKQRDKAAKAKHKELVGIAGKEKTVKEGYRPRTKQLAPGDSKLKTGAIDKHTGERKVFKVIRVK